MSKGPMIVALLNTVAGLGAIGVIVYTQVLFKRPPITESQQRDRIEEERVESVVDGEKGTVLINNINVNIKPTTQTNNGRKRKIEHFVRFSVAFEIRDINEQGAFEEIKPIFMDRLIAHLAKKSFDSLSSVQGRYLLRSELIALGNDLMKKNLLSNAYFNEFVVQ